MSAFGVIVGNRGFFPDSPVQQGRKVILEQLDRAGFDAVCPTPEQTELGAVPTRRAAAKCAELFRRNAERIHGIIVTLPNFGDERSVAETIRLANLDVPVLVQACPDEPEKMRPAERRDAFCGKISVCSNLKQYGIPFSLTDSHTVALKSERFRAELDRFDAVCRVVGGLKRARIGAIGTRPAAFNTVRYSEKILESHGITVEPIDLSDILAAARALPDDDPAVAEKASALRNYCATGGVGDEPINRMARLGVAIASFIEEHDLDACAIQCWTSIQQNYGVAPCAVMSMLSDSLTPAACEVDVCGALSMYALQLASASPSAILDWNNNYGDAPDKCVCFHCSNIPAQLLERPRMGVHEILAGAVGRENAYGVCNGRIKAGPITFASLMTDDTAGAVRAFVGEGRFTDDPIETFGGYGVLEVAGLQGLMRHICQGGFEHHVAVNFANSADVLHEAFTRYLDIDTYRHL